MRLTSVQRQKIEASLASLKRQRRALLRSIEEVEHLLERLEAADDAALKNEAREKLESRYSPDRSARLGASESFDAP